MYRIMFNNTDIDDYQHLDQETNFYRHLMFIKRKNNIRNYVT